MTKVQISKIVEVENVVESTVKTSQPNRKDVKKYLHQLSEFLQKEYPNVIPIPSRSQEARTNGKTTNIKAPLYAHKDLTTAQLWDKWFTVGIQAICREPTHGLALILREDFIVIDIDDVEIGDQLEDLCEAFKLTPKQRTKKGVHYFFKRTQEADDAEIYDLVRGLLYEDGTERPIDIKTKRPNNKEAGIISVYPSINKTWERDILTTPLQDLPSVFIKFYNETKAKTTPRKRSDSNDEDNTTTHEGISFEDLQDIVANLAFKRAHEYQHWIKCVWAIYNIAKANGYIRKGKNMIHDFSKQSPKYDEDEVEDYIDRATWYEGGVGLATLLMYLKEDDELTFNRMRVKLNPQKVTIDGYSIQEIDEFKDINLLDGQQRDYETVKRVFEKTHFKVSSNKPLYVQVRGEGEYEEMVERTRKDFIDVYENLYNYERIVKPPKKRGDEPKEVIVAERFIGKWLADPVIRTYTAINFLPPPKVCPPSVYNTWRGLRAERLTCEATADITPLINHLKIICGQCDKATDYVLNWCAHIVQRPGELSGTALCFESGEGAGKNTIFTELLGKRILGDTFYRETNDPTNDLFAKHANAYKNTLLVNIDEAERKDLHANANRFKSLITNERQRLEKKGIDQCNINSYARYIITTNADEVLKITSKDRRFVLIKSSDEKCGDREYFKQLYELIKREDVQKTFYEYLKQRDISAVDWINDRPKTEAYYNTLDSNISPIVRFMASLVCDYERLNITSPLLKANELFSKFNDFLTLCKSKYSCENTYFGRQVSKMSGIDKERRKYGNIYSIDVAKLKEYLERVEKYDFDKYAIIDFDLDDE